MDDTKIHAAIHACNLTAFVSLCKKNCLNVVPIDWLARTGSFVCMGWWCTAAMQCSCAVPTCMRGAMRGGAACAHSGDIDWRWDALCSGCCELCHPPGYARVGSVKDLAWFSGVQIPGSRVICLTRIIIILIKRGSGNNVRSTCKTSTP